MQLGIIDTIASFLLYVVPGYIYLSVTEYFRLSSTKPNYEAKLISSVVISAVVSSLVKAIFGFFEITEIEVSVHVILSCTICFIIALIFGFFHRQFLAEENKNPLFGTVDEDNIWPLLFPVGTTSDIRVYGNYLGDNVTIIGGLCYWTPLEDGSCDIVVSNYKIVYDDDSVFDSCDHPESSYKYLYFNSKNFTFIESSISEEEIEKVEIETDFNHYKD